MHSWEPPHAPFDEPARPPATAAVVGQGIPIRIERRGIGWRSAATAFNSRNAAAICPCSSDSDAFRVSQFHTVGIFHFALGQDGDGLRQIARFRVNASTRGENLRGTLAAPPPRGDLERRAAACTRRCRPVRNAVPALLRAAVFLKALATRRRTSSLDHLAAEAPQRAPEILAARARIDAESAICRQAIAVLTKAKWNIPTVWNCDTRRHRCPKNMDRLRPRCAS